VPALAKKVDLVVGVDAAFKVERQMEIQQGSRRTGTRDGALFCQGFRPGRIGAEAGSAANGGILALHLAVEHALGGGIVADFFIGQDGHQAFLQSAKAAFNLAFGLRAGSDQVGYPQCGEGALELGAGIAVIGHGIVAKEAEAVGVHDQRQAVLEKETAKMLEMIPRGVSGDKDGTEEFAGMIIDGQQQGLLFLGGPPLVDGRIVLPQFIDARAFPTPPGLGTRFRLADELWKMGSGEGGHRLAMAFETQASFQFVGHQLEVGRLLKRQELLEEGDGCWRPVRPMVAAGELGGEVGAFSEEAGAEPVKVGAADLELKGGLSEVDLPRIELLKDLPEKQVGEPFCDLLFLIAPVKPTLIPWSRAFVGLRYAQTSSTPRPRDSSNLHITCPLLNSQPSPFVPAPTHIC